jgi:hypothetical protein
MLVEFARWPARSGRGLSATGGALCPPASKARTTERFYPPRSAFAATALRPECFGQIGAAQKEKRAAKEGPLGRQGPAQEHLLRPTPRIQPERNGLCSTLLSPLVDGSDELVGRPVEVEIQIDHVRLLLAIRSYTDGRIAASPWR